MKVIIIYLKTSLFSLAGLVSVRFTIKGLQQKKESKTSLKVLFVWLSYITKITFLIRVLEENVIQIFEHEIFLAFLCLDI